MPRHVMPASNRWRAAAAGLLVALTLLAYLPALRNGFIWDDDQYVTANLELRTPAGLASIWLTPGSAEHSYGQYYPLVYTTYWLEYRLWQLDPLGYHLVNVLLHALAVVLLWRVLQRLDVPGAWLAAAVFAVHPVHVETVAWITERKKVLSGALYLGAALCYLSFAGIAAPGATSERPPAAGRWRWYAAACALFLGALLSKTVTCTLPVALLLVLWWKRGRVGWRDAAPLLPLLIVGLGLGLTTAWIERARVFASGPEWEFTPIERVLIASRAVCFYAAKLAWPAQLTFIYPRWTIDSGSGGQWLFVLVCAASVAGLWRLRRRLGTGPLVAALVFVVTLGPALGFVNVYPMRFSFVADHFQYLGSIGLVALGAAAGTLYVLPRHPAARRALAAVVLGVLATLTWRQLPIYANQETLWLDTLAKNPDCWMAHNNLGMQRLMAGRTDEAIAEFETTLRLNPRHEKAESNLGNALFLRGHKAEAIAHFERALQLRPDFADAHTGLALALGSTGRVDEALAHLEHAVALQPRSAEAQYNLALGLLNAGRLDEAIAHGERAIELAPDDAQAQNNLGLALAQAGRVAEATAHFEQALRLRPDFAEARANLERARALSGRP